MNNIKEKYLNVSADCIDLGSSSIRLQNIMEILRNECEWDRKQDHKSLKKHLIEESYEVIDAIDRGDSELLQEELGDLLFQVYFHSLIISENSGENIISVINGVCNKMIRRHPKIFSKESIKSIDKNSEKWENIKRYERNGVSTSEDMDLISKSLPSLMRAKKIQSKAKNEGFDWDDVSGAIKKVKEELSELEEAITTDLKSRMLDEFGDLLFSVVNISSFLDIDPEEALSHTNQKFINRYAKMEKSALLDNKTLDSMSLEEMDALWEEAKSSEKV